MNTYKENLNKVRSLLGSYEAIGIVCGISGRAVKKWYDSGRPPRTEYSGETQYAKRIAESVNGQVNEHDLKPCFKDVRA